MSPARVPGWTSKYQQHCSVTFMGHKLSEKGVEPDQSKVEAIKEMPRPADKAALQRCLGMCQYLSKFCPNLSETVPLLRDLTKQDAVLYGLTRMKTLSVRQGTHYISYCPALSTITRLLL